MGVKKKCGKKSEKLGVKKFTVKIFFLFHSIKKLDIIMLIYVHFL